MIGVLRIGQQDWPLLTLRELVTRYDAVLIDEWDRTALLAVINYNLMVTTANANGMKPPLRPKEFFDFHPFRNRSTVRKPISSMETLKAFGDALVR